MDQVDFEPALHWTATILKADDQHSETDFQTRLWDMRLLFWSLNTSEFHVVYPEFVHFVFCSLLMLSSLSFAHNFVLSISSYVMILFSLCWSSPRGREIFKSPVLIKAGGGIHNYLYQLQSSSQESVQMKSNVLGKLQITWRTNLGEPGRLQTQQILGSVSADSIQSVQ